MQARRACRPGQARGQDERPSDSSIHERPSTAREASNGRPGGLGEGLKGSLESQVESKLRLEASLKGQVASKRTQRGVQEASKSGQGVQGLGRAIARPKRRSRGP